MPVWTKDDLHETVARSIGDLKLIVVSNREPYIHRRRNGHVECFKPASGLTSALDPILQAAGGVWIAHGSGDADFEAADHHDHVWVPPGRPSYKLRRVWLTPDMEREYYYGLANQGLWPLCHNAFHKPRFTLKNWVSYRKVNELFAEAVLEEASASPAFVFIQDYHFGLLPRMLKERNPRLTVAQFWHIPWPNRETFRVFPWKEELLDGLLGNDLLGFQLGYYCSNFLDTIDRNVEALVDGEHSRVTRKGRATSVRAFPISIDFTAQETLAASSEVRAATAKWVQEMGRMPELLGIGIDRIDYTKGIPDRIHGLDAFFEENPEYIGRLTFLQVGAPSRSEIDSYERLDSQLCQQVTAFNQKWGRGDWRPLLFVRRHVDQTALAALHQMADFCLISSLHDGMNLVAKEFVASRIDGDGVLILSAFTGAARELADAIAVNPFSADDIAASIQKALIMPADERYARMNRMRAAVANNSIYRWGAKILLAAAGCGDQPFAAAPVAEPLPVSFKTASKSLV